MPSIFSNPNIMQMAGLSVMSGTRVGDAIKDAVLSDATMQQQAFQQQQMQVQQAEWQQKQEARDALLNMSPPADVDPDLWAADPELALKYQGMMLDAKTKQALLTQASVLFSASPGVAPVEAPQGVPAPQGIAAPEAVPAPQPVGAPPAVEAPLPPSTPAATDWRSDPNELRKRGMQALQLGMYDAKYATIGKSLMDQADSIEKSKSNKSEKSFDQANTLRDEYQKRAEPFITQRDAYSRIQASAEDPSAAGDLALIFNYMKVLDPGSTVREGEFATAQNAGGVGERLAAQYNKVMSGERLTPDMRKDFVDRSNKLYSKASKSYATLGEQYTKLSKHYGIDPAGVITDFSEGVTIPTSAPQGAKLIGTSGGKNVYQLPDGSHVLEQ
jgi:hypothetical protein